MATTIFEKVALAVAVRSSSGIDGLARAWPTFGSATIAAAVSSSERHASTVSSRTATSKAASA